VEPLSVTAIISKIDITPISAGLRDELSSQLAVGETVVAIFEPDLNTKLHFANGLVVLSDRRILALDGIAVGDEADANSRAPAKWRSWQLTGIRELRIRDASGLGARTLRISGSCGSGRLACPC